MGIVLFLRQTVNKAAGAADGQFQLTGELAELTLTERGEIPCIVPAHHLLEQLLEGADSPEIPLPFRVPPDQNAACRGENYGKQPNSFIHRHTSADSPRPVRVRAGRCPRRAWRAAG